MDIKVRPDARVAYQRQRARFVRHLVDDGRFDEGAAQALIDRWEREATQVHRRRGTTAYWKDAWLWIANEGSPSQVATKRDMGAAADGQVYGG
jgi:hypothetical protein